MNMNTATVSLAVTPTVVSTLLAHYLNRRPLRQRPTAHLSYDEGLHLIRSFLVHASHHTVEELQAFTSQWVPHPQWVKVDEVQVPGEQLDRAAALLEEQLGPEGLRRVGGRRWWQWRSRPQTPLRAEWIEMRADYHERRRAEAPCRRVMLYVHGGAYFFGSVDEHRYQMQRHARKLKARVFAPRYRLAPQFPFPCGLQDCLAAYLHLLTVQDPSQIVLAGDSAGGGMVVSMLVTLRDRGIPLPAGAVLISPWVDLTHSFPSVAGDSPLDYIPPAGFHHKPSASWPPPDEEQLEQLKKLAMEEKRKKAATRKGKVETSEGTPTSADVARATTRLHLTIDGEDIEIKEQIQMYTTNELLAHPLVSPAMQPTLGGLPPLLIMVGGGEMLRDEQIYLAHKCANPTRYAPSESLLDDQGREQVAKYKPTDVQLQVWDDLCHVAPTLSFTHPAKYMYRSIAQFGAWALARAQRTEIEILDDDQISVISHSDSESDEGPEDRAVGPPRASHETSAAELTARCKAKEQAAKEQAAKEQAATQQSSGQIGKAGDPLPPFRNHMIRQRVTRHGVVFPLAPASELPGCTMSNELVGVIKQGPVKKWLYQKKQWEDRFSHARAKVQKRFIRELVEGYEGFGEGELPPPSALAGRRRKAGVDAPEKKRAKSVGLALWALWGSKHDEATIHRERQADKEPEVQAASAHQGRGARPFSDVERQEGQAPRREMNRSRSRRRVIRDEHQTDGVDEDTPAAELLARRDAEGPGGAVPAAPPAAAGGGLLSPDYLPDMGVTGKRPYVDGIAVPFSLRNEADTASMMTLTSNAPLSPRPTSPATTHSAADGDVATPLAEGLDGAAHAAPAPAGRPKAETFVTADELPRATGSRDTAAA